MTNREWLESLSGEQLDEFLRKHPALFYAGDKETIEWGESEHTED